MAKKKLYTIDVRRSHDGKWEPYIEIDHQTIVMEAWETKVEAVWAKRQMMIALDRLIQKAKEQ